MKYWREIALSVLSLITIAAVAATAITLLRDDSASAGEATGDPAPAATPALLRDPPPIYASLPAGVVVEGYASGLSAPVAVDGTADGRVFVIEQFVGIVRVIEDGVVQAEPFYVVDDLYVPEDRGFINELGLVGMLIDRDASPMAMYLYYTAVTLTGERSTKLIRIVEQDGRGADPQTIVEIPGDPDCCHVGGGMAWMPDGTILLSVGDHEMRETVQSLQTLHGKVLRIDRDGAAPPDNPDFGDPEADPRIFAVGFRNAFGIAVDPAGPMYALDNGELGYDNVHLLVGGANYGHPPSANVPDTPRPLKTYLEATGISGADVYRGGTMPAFDGALLFCQFHNFGALHWFQLRPASSTERDRIVVGGCSSGLRVLPDGNVYFIDYLLGNVMRLRPAS